MIDYIPADIPTAIIDYVHAHTNKNDNTIEGTYIKYLTIWKNRYEIYAYGYIRKNPLLTGKNPVLIYDCHDVRKPTLTEIRDIHWFLPKYITSSKNKSEHLCHRDLNVFNQHNIPNPYKNKTKYHNPRYVPKPVQQYVNQLYPVSWYPGANDRYIKYLTSYKDKYEVYSVQWKERNSDITSKEKYILFDCKNTREYQDDKERIDLILLQVNKNSIEKPIFCKSKYNK